MGTIGVPQISSIFYGSAKPPVFSSRMEGAHRREAAQIVADLLGPLENESDWLNRDSHRMPPWEIAALREQISILPKGTSWEVLGSRLPGEEEFHSGGIVFEIPEALPEGAFFAGCGIKGPLVEKLVEFTLPNGTPTRVVGIDCAIMEIFRSIVHYHGISNEKYIPRNPKDKDLYEEFKKRNSALIARLGKVPLGLMYLEKRDGTEFEVQALKAGEGLDLIPLVRHGWVGLQGPTDLFLDFHPALVKKPTEANISEAEIALRRKFRDEKIDYDDSYLRIKEAIK